MKHNKRQPFNCKLLGWRLLLLSLAVLVSMPVIYIVIQSFAGTPSSYFTLIAENPAFSAAFQNSVFLCLASLSGQLIVSILGGWGLARYHFPGKKVILFLCGVLMLIPTQALLLPQYLMLKPLHLLNRLWSLVLPLTFSPLGSLLLWHGFSAIPREEIESAEIAGANLFTVLHKIALPMCKREISMLVIISVSESWNLLEQPMAYIKTPTRYPLSVYLSTASITDPKQLLAACVLTLVPVAALFFALAKSANHID